MVNIKDLNFRLGDFKINIPKLDIKDGEYFVLLGPTGSGKTELIKAIAGIRSVEEGEIFLNDSKIDNLSPENREIGYMPQNYKLFPHLTVQENIEFGIEDNESEKAEELMNLVGISHLSERSCTNCLSGGEQQRVALARALAIEPELLLLDEPLGSLDAETSERLRSKIKGVHKELGTTTIHITHDLDDAMYLGDRVGIMEDGDLIKVGKPEKVLSQNKLFKSSGLGRDSVKSFST